VQRAVAEAARKAALAKRMGPHLFLLTHADASTTQIDTHVLNRGPRSARSPFDTL
jgi:hypothetical protein